jgi:DNA-binding LacI/PurR family transcriptional regulator
VAYTNKGATGWKEVYDRLKESIANGTFAPGSQLPTEAQLIQDFGASKMTVHRAVRELANSGLVRRVERVGTFVAESLSGAQAARGKIGLFLPTTEGFLEIKLISGIGEVAGSDRHLVLYGTDNDTVLEAELLEKAAAEVDGILILSTCHPKIARRLVEINAGGCPVVCIDREPTSERLPSVTTNNYAATKEGVEYLIRAGHRQIAFFGLYAMEQSSLADRYRGYFDAMQEVGVDPRPLARFMEARVNDDYFAELPLFEDAILRLSSGDNPITAAFCVNEHYLSVLLEVCQLLPENLRQRFEIVAFCDWPTLSFPTVRTHLIRQDAKAVGRAAAARLLMALSGEAQPIEREEIAASFDPSLAPVSLGQFSREGGGRAT